MLQLADILPDVVILTAFLKETYDMSALLTRRVGIGGGGCHGICGFEI